MGQITQTLQHRRLCLISNYILYFDLDSPVIIPDDLNNFLDVMSLSFWSFRYEFLSNWCQVFGLIIPEKKENVPKYDKKRQKKVHKGPKNESQKGDRTLSFSSVPTL